MIKIITTEIHVCDFCGREQNDPEVPFMIPNPDHQVAICCFCVERCHEAVHAAMDEEFIALTQDTSSTPDSNEPAGSEQDVPNTPTSSEEPT